MHVYCIAYNSAIFEDLKCKWLTVYKIQGSHCFHPEAKMVPLLPPANEVWGKVIFSEACVKNSVHGGRGGGGVPGPGGSPGPQPRGKLRGESGPGPQPRWKLRGIWSRPTTKGEVEGDLVQAHTQGGSWEGSGPGPHPWGKLRGKWPASPLRWLLLRAVRILLECILVIWRIQ